MLILLVPHVTNSHILPKLNGVIPKAQVWQQ
jgi:hypothetical protein